MNYEKNVKKNQRKPGTPPVPRPKVFFTTIFTPKNNPPKLRNSKMSLKVIFLGHPVYRDLKKIWWATTFNFVQ